MSDKNRYHNLNYRFRAIRKTGIPVQFEDMAAFVRWSLENGYQYGMTLVRIDEDGPWSPDNCRWVDKPRCEKNQGRTDLLAKQWDDFTALIREYLKSCTVPEPPAPPKVEFFRYEHPDLEKEGITWGIA